MKKISTIPWQPFSDKHKVYIKNARNCKMSVAEGAIRSGKTIDNCIIAAAYLEICRDKIHLASGSTMANAKLNIGVCNGFGLESLFRGRCRWGKYKDSEALFLRTQTGEKIVLFTGGGKADSYKRILGNSYGLWIATEINEHYDSEDSRESFVKVAFGRQVAAQDPLILWDLNPSSPRHKIYTDYIDKYRTDYVGGYNYERFTLNDNLSITDERKLQIRSQYNVNSVWYRRDILGERCIAEGLIYKQYADNPCKYDGRLDEYRDKEGKSTLRNIKIGVDFGGNKSNHAFVASGTVDYSKWVIVASRSIPAPGTDVDDLIKMFIEFAGYVEMTYGSIVGVYCDSEEQTIINTIRARTGLPIYNAFKGSILNRIRFTDIMLSTDRIFLLPDNEPLKRGLSEARWDPKHDDTRLDDGSSDIDILDAFEYSVEPDIFLYERWSPA